MTSLEPFAHLAQPKTGATNGRSGLCRFAAAQLHFERSNEGDRSYQHRTIAVSQSSTASASLAHSSRPGLAQRLAQCCRGDGRREPAEVMGKSQSKQSRGVRQQDSWQRREVMPPSEGDKAAADRLRLEGNQMFAKGKYGAALEVRRVRTILMWRFAHAGSGDPDWFVDQTPVCDSSVLLQRYTEALTLNPMPGEMHALLTLSVAASVTVF